MGNSSPPEADATDLLEALRALRQLIDEDQMIADGNTTIQEQVEFVELLASPQPVLDDLMNTLKHVDSTIESTGDVRLGQSDASLEELISYVSFLGEEFPGGYQQGQQQDISEVTSLAIQMNQHSFMMAYPAKNTIELLANSHGNYETPGVVFIEDDGPVAVGQQGTAYEMRYPDRTIQWNRASLGQSTEHDIGDNTYHNTQILGILIKKLKKDAENRLGTEIKEAVITIPWGFGIRARKAVVDAAHIGNLDVSLIDEPTAACYGYDAHRSEDEIFLVYQLDQKSFTATIIQINTVSQGTPFDSPAAVIRGEVDEHTGMYGIGIEALRDRVYEYTREDLLKQGANDPDDDSRLEVDLRERVDNATDALCNRRSATIAIRDEEVYTVDITRDKFHDLTVDIVNKTIEEVESLFQDTEHDPEDIDDVLMVGPGASMQHVQESVTDYFGFRPSVDDNPETILVRGAAAFLDEKAEQR